MLTFRPHKLHFLIEKTGEYDANNGDFVPGCSFWSKKAIDCRFVYNSEAKQITFADGVNRAYNYEVFMDLDVRRFAIGETVRLYDMSGTQVAEMTVQGYRKTQLGTKLWL